MKNIYRINIMIALLAIVFIAGCGNKVAGEISTELTKNKIKNGDITTLIVDAKNTGNVAGSFIVKVIPEDASKLTITYSGSLEDLLQVGETMGEKRVTIQGLTDHTQTVYRLTTQLIDAESNRILSEKTDQITVQKS